MESENVTKVMKEYYSPQDLEYLTRIADIKNEANGKIQSLRNENKKLKKEIVGLKQEKKRLKYSCKAVYEEIDESNSTNTELNDRIENVIAILEDRDDMTDILRVLKGEGNEVYIEREEQTS